MRKKLRVLHLSTSDINGGAAIAAYRLHKSLIRENVDSFMLVNRQYTSDKTILRARSFFQLILSKLRRKIDQIPLLRYPKKQNTLFSSQWFSGFPIKKINEISPDIIHIHWINGGFLSLDALKNIKNIPILWTLHDMWPFTGGCHYVQDCDHYLNHCGHCPLLSSKKENDLSKSNIQKKKFVYSQKNILFICPSRWIKECAEKSFLLKNSQTEVIPNMVDTKVFQPFDKRKVSKEFNFPQDKKIILFGAVNATEDKRKGYHLLISALEHFFKSNEKEDFILVIFGSENKEMLLDLPTIFTGHISNEEQLAKLYSCADLMIVPSLQEVWGQTITESLSCATPVVAFNQTGPKDIIDHKINGYLAEAFCPKDLSKGIEWCLNHPDQNKLSKLCREKSLQFSSRIITEKVINTYLTFQNKNL